MHKKTAERKCNLLARNDSLVDLATA